MLERRQDAHLVAKAAHRLFASRRPVDDLERDRAAEVLGLLFGEKDPSHAAATELAHDPIGADALGKWRLEILEIVVRTPGSAIERRFSAVGALEQVHELRRQTGIAAGKVVEQRPPPGIVELEGAREELRKSLAHGERHSTTR